MSDAQIIVAAIFLLLWILNAAPAVMVMRRQRHNPHPVTLIKDRLGTAAIYLTYYFACAYALYVLVSTEIHWFGAAAGLMLFTLGIVLRWRGLHDLKEFYSGDVRLRYGHQLVTSGIYSKMRHPLHAGILLEMVGMCLMAPHVAIVSAMAIMAVIMFRRNRIEDEILLVSFGQQAHEYQENVPALGLSLRHWRSSLTDPTEIAPSE